MAETESVNISERADETTRQLLFELGKVARVGMETIDDSLEVYARHPDTVSDVVAFLSDNPEKFPILKAVVAVMDAEADSDLEISDKDLEEIKKDPEFEQLHQANLAARDPEAKKSAVVRLRSFWLKKGLVSLSAVHDPAA